MIKKLSAVLIIVLLLIFQIAPIASATGLEPNRKGSLTINMEYNGAEIPNIELRIYQVARIGFDNGESSYILTDAFADANVDFSDLSPRRNVSIASILSDYAERNDISGTVATTDENGQALFENLPVGLYLIEQISTHSRYEYIAPFLVSLPTDDVDGPVYDLVMAPKTEITRTTEPIKPLPPDPIDPEHPLVPTEKGYEEIDENGVPLGEWTYDEEELTWIFDEYPPLAELPQTGMLKWPVPVMAALGLLLFGLGWMMRSRGKKNEA